jgi:hypothetical protein
MYFNTSKRKAIQEAKRVNCAARAGYGNDDPAVIWAGWVCKGAHKAQLIEKPLCSVFRTKKIFLL